MRAPVVFGLPGAYFDLALLWEAKDVLDPQGQKTKQMLRTLTGELVRVRLEGHNNEIYDIHHRRLLAKYPLVVDRTYLVQPRWTRQSETYLGWFPCKPWWKETSAEFTLVAALVQKYL
jgi:hypothetical protein